MAYARIQIKDCKALLKKVDDMKKAPETVLKRMTADATKRVPGWVATGVTKRYGVKKGEITGNKIGKMQIKGKGFRDLKFIYSGRLLTPTHFGMTPKTPKPDRGSYTLKATIIKGKRTTLGKVKKLTKKQLKNTGKNLRREGTRNSNHSPIMLMRANGGQYLPFQRKSPDRKDIKAIKVTSLPQMIDSDNAREDIQGLINEGLEKRLAHHMKIMEK